MKTDGTFETGRRYEAVLSKDGYLKATADFEVVRSAGGTAFEFGNPRLSLTPSGQNTVGFLVDTTSVALDAGKQAELRITIGDALDKKHHALNWYSEESLDAALRARTSGESLRSATTNNTPWLQTPPMAQSGPVPAMVLQYVIKLK